MGCSNTKSFPAGTGMENSSPLTNAMNALNTIDPSEVVEEGQKLINQGQEKISQMIDEGEKMLNQANEALEKSAAALESAIGKNPFDESEKIDDVSKELAQLTESAEEELKAELEIEEIETRSTDCQTKEDEHYTVTSPVDTADTSAEKEENGSESNIENVDVDETENDENKDFDKSTNVLLEEVSEEQEETEQNEQTESECMNDESNTDIQANANEELQAEESLNVNEEISTNEESNANEESGTNEESSGNEEPNTNEEPNANEESNDESKLTDTNDVSTNAIDETENTNEGNDK